MKIVVVGLGYVGLPLARLFSTKYKTLGFDINQKRVEALNRGEDDTLEVSNEILSEAIAKFGFRCTSSLDEVRGFAAHGDTGGGFEESTVFIVTVPTP
ncbi:MAG: nucleotide sugar dehydrogenase, partial [Bacteroidales bacterium]